MTAEKVLAIARAELGTQESPRGSNRVKYNTWYYGREVSGSRYPWCMAFVQWVMAQAGVAVPVKTASCGALMRAAKKAGQWVTGDYRPGDVLIYDFPGGAATDHTGIAEQVYESSVIAIEGNTSVSNASNGGEVRRTMRDISLVVGAWRPPYMIEEDNMTKEDVIKIIQEYEREKAQKPAQSWGSEWEEAREWAESEGIIKGDENGNKQYQSYTTRQAMVLFLYRFLKLLKCI